MAIIHGQDANQNQYPVLTDASGRIIPAALDTGGNYVPLKVDASGRVIPAGLVSGNTYVPLLVDASGRVLLAAEDAGATRRPVLCDGSGRLYVAVKGDDQPWSIKNVWSERVFSTTLAAGTNTFNTAAVGAGKIQVVTNIAFTYAGTVAGVALWIKAIMSGNERNIYLQSPPVSAVWYSLSRQIYLAAGDNMRFLVTGATLNDDAYCDFTGYEMTAP